MNLLFATNNQHKLTEVRLALGNRFTVTGLREAGIDEEIPETMDTIEGNSIQKAEYIYNKYRLPCFADDTGLEILALENRPGIYSARYAGPECDPAKNMAKVLEELTGITNRRARFKTVIAFCENQQTMLFEGIIEGNITTDPVGSNGFGYDPIFIPDGFQKTFAEMNAVEKNAISHRSRALHQFIFYLKTR